MGLWNIFTASSCLLTGFLIDRLGFVRVVVGGAILMIVPALFYTLVGNHLAAVLALRILQAVGAGPATASIGVLAATWFPPHQRGFVAGLYGIATCLGVASGFMASPAVYAGTHSWLAAMSWMAVAPIRRFGIDPSGPLWRQAAGHFANRVRTSRSRKRFQAVAEDFRDLDSLRHSLHQLLVLHRLQRSYSGLLCHRAAHRRRLRPDGCRPPDDALPGCADHRQPGHWLSLHPSAEGKSPVDHQHCFSGHRMCSPRSSCCPASMPTCRFCRWC